MQVVGLPGHVIRTSRAASRRLDAKTPHLEAERRRVAVTRWRRAMENGLTSVEATHAVGEARANLYRWEERAEPRRRRPHRPRREEPSAWTGGGG